MAGTIARVGLVVLVLGLGWGEAAGQTTTPEPERRLSVEGAFGLQTHYRGTAQSVAFGFAPTRSLTLLVSAERSHIQDRINVYDDGYGAERGDTEQFVSVELRYAFLPRRRVSPYVVVGTGRGVSRPNVSEYFPDVRERTIQTLYYGGGVRMPINPRFDWFVDGRFTMSVEGRSDFFAVRMPVRAGVALRF